MWTWLCKDIALGGRWLALVILLFIFQLAVGVISGWLFFVWGMTLPVLLAIGALLIETIDETEVLWCSLPLTRGDIVRGRYFSVLAGVLTGTAISWSVGQISARFIFSLPGGPPAFLRLSVHALLFSFLLFGLALFLPFYFRFGLSNGAKYFLATFLGVMFVGALVTQVSSFLVGSAGSPFDPWVWMQVAALFDSRPAPPSAGTGLWFLGFFLVLSLAAFTGSAALSTKFYRAREF